MADEKMSRAERRAAKRVANRRKNAAILAASIVLAGALGWSAAERLPIHVPSSIVALGSVGLASYTMFFLLSEAALLVLTIVNIRDEKVHNRYRALMLLVVYVFTLRYRRVLPAKFFAETPQHKNAPEDKLRESGKHRHKSDAKAAASPQSPPPASSPVTDEEVRTAFALLITRMTAVLKDFEVDRAIVDAALRHVTDSAEAASRPLR
jgi:Ca2+/H+ antiporter